MTFNLTVSVKTGDSVPEVKAITTELQAATDKAKAFEAAAAKGGKVAAEAFKAAKREVDALLQVGLGPAAAAFSKLTDVLEREARALERIRGPMREHRADLDALDRLYKKGALSALEYETEINRLVKAQGTMHGPVRQEQQEAPKGPGLGAGVGVIMGAAGALGIEAAIGKVSGLIDGYFRLKDIYIEASNSAIKFADSTHTVDQVLREQIALAGQLHSNYQTTIQLYDAVRDGTDELNVSHGEQIRLLRSLSQSAMLSGKSLESVGGMMSKFSYALASGHIEQRTLRGMMIEMPELAAIWIAKFGGTREAVLRMVKDGRAGVEDLMMSLIDAGKPIEALDKNFNKLINTEAKMKAAFETNVELYRSQGDTSNASVAQRAIEIARGQGDTYGDPIAKAIQAQRGLNKTWSDLTTDMIDRAGKVSAEWARAHEEMNSSQKALLASIKDPVDAGKVALDNLNKLFGLGKISIEEYTKAYSGLVAQIGDSTAVMREALKSPFDAARQGLVDLKKLRAEGAEGATGEAGWKKQKEFLTALNNGELPETIKLWEALNAPAKQYGLTIGALDSLFARHTITARQYNDALQELNKTNVAAARAAGGNRDLPGFIGQRKIGGLATRISFDQSAGSDGNAPGAVTGGQIRGLEVQSQQYLDNIDIVMRWKQAQQDVTSVLHGTSEEQAIAAEVLATLTEFESRLVPVTGELTAQVEAQVRARRSAAEQFGREQRIMEEITKPQKDYADQLAAVQALHGQLTAEQYSQQIDKVRAAYLAASAEGKTFAGGMEAAWLRMKAEAEGFGETVANTLVGDLDKLNEALVTAANGGKVAWGDMVDSMIQDLERMLIKQLEVLAITALLNAIYPGAGAVAQQTGVTGAGVDYASTARTAPGAFPSPTAGSVGSVATQASTAATVIQVHNHYNEDVGVAAIKSPAGNAAILNVLRANKGYSSR